MAVNATKLAGISLGAGDTDVKMLIPDFPFDYGQYLVNGAKSGLGAIPSVKYGTPIAVVGGGVAGHGCRL